MFWGYKENCYKFGDAVTSGDLHSTECFKDDSLPFLAFDDDELISILRQMVPVFKQNISLFIGTSNGYVTVEGQTHLHTFSNFKNNKSNKGVHIGCKRNIKLGILSHFNT